MSIEVKKKNKDARRGQRYGKHIKCKLQEEMVKLGDFAVTSGFEESSRIICSLAETVQQTKASFETISARRV